MIRRSCCRTPSNPRLPFFASIPRRTGWRGEWRYGLLNDIRVLDAKRYPRMIDRFVALGRADGLPRGRCRDAMPGASVEPQLTADSIRARALVTKLELDADRDVLALCPGAEYGPAKRWPPAHYAVVAADYVRRGGVVWLFGANGDAPGCAAITAALTPEERACVFDLAGRTSLPTRSICSA